MSLPEKSQMVIDFIFGGIVSFVGETSGSIQGFLLALHSEITLDRGTR